MSGHIVLKGSPPSPVFILEQEAEIQYDDPKLRAGRSFRKVKLVYASENFENASNLGAAASVLKLPREPKGTRFVEVVTSLEIDGAEEAGIKVNVPLDIPLPPVLPHPTETIAAGCFAFDRAFPTPAMVPALRLAKAIANTDGNQLGIYAHTDSVGSDSFNKSLSDRRGRATLALLTGDSDEFEAVAAEDAWDTKVYQAMLRGLGCNPGPIDGAPGPMTEAATRQFQTEYNRGLFHTQERSRAFPDLPETGQLDDTTKAALRDAHLSHFSQGLDPSTFAGPKFSGCSEFVPISKDAKENRRITLAVYREVPPADEDFPCVVGDASACDLDGELPRRCRFYRKHVLEPKAPPKPFFTDFEWLKRPDGRFYLSAISSAPDGTKATFSVVKTDKPPPAPAPSSLTQPGSPAALGPEVGSPVEGTVELGIAGATWAAPEGFDPFDVEQWLVNVGVPRFEDQDEPELEPGAEPDRIGSDDFFHPPLFRIETEKDWAYSGPPGERLARSILNRSDGGGAGGVAIQNDGVVKDFETAGPRIVAEREVFAIRIGLLPQDVIEDEEVEELG